MQSCCILGTRRGIPRTWQFFSTARTFPVPPMPSGSSASCGRKILVVDDNPLLRALMCDLIAEPGDEVVECGNGELAVTTYRQLRPDVVLMDIEIEGINGLRATREICRIDPRARIVMVTQYRSPAFQAAARQAGAAAYVLKEELETLPAILKEVHPYPHVAHP